MLGWFQQSKFFALIVKDLNSNFRKQLTHVRPTLEPILLGKKTSHTVWGEEGLDFRGIWRYLSSDEDFLFFTWVFLSFEISWEINKKYEICRNFYPIFFFVHKLSLIYMIVYSSYLIFVLKFFLMYVHIQYMAHISADFRQNFGKLTFTSTVFILCLMCAYQL